jgi:all-trans-retinol 13,14-reductase
VSEGYDAAIIGAGIGGLTAAACLAREGLRVLVLEREPHAGGTAYTFVRRGYQFPMGPLGFSSPGPVREAWEGLTGGELRLRRVGYLLRAFGLEVPLSLPYPRLEEELKALFPGEAEGIRGFFDAVRGEAARGFQGASSDRPAGTLLRSLVSDGRLRRILGSQGTREPYSGLGLLASMWELMCAEGIHYPEGGFRRFCDALAEAVAAGGGEIRLRTGVAGINTSCGRTTGVFLQNGSFIPAGAVVSNADFKSTFLDLMDPGQVPEEWWEAVLGARQSSSSLQVALGVDAARVDLSAFSHTSRVIYRRDTGDPGPGESGLGGADRLPEPEALAAQELELCLWSAEDPGLAPAGGAVVVIRTAVSHEGFTRFRTHRVARTPGYAGYKERLAAALTGEAASLLPGLESAAEVVDVATPLTFEDRGGRSGGAVAGWSWEHEDGPGSGGAARRELVRTPLAGLYMAGYQAFTSLTMGGVPTAMRSGQLAAEAVLSGAPPATEVNIPRPAPIPP